ncbi:MAG: cytochrome c3 family protein [Bacteroidota bacterium]
MRTSNIITVLLSIGLAFVLLILAQALFQNYALPGNNIGYEPVQPIAYSHRLHAGELGIDCKFCHSGVEQSRTAGIPSANVCMECHRFVTAPFNQIRAEDELAQQENRKPRRIVSPEIQKLYDALGLDTDLLKTVSARESRIAWVKVHSLPDFAYFDHRAHVGATIDCQTCHGEVQTMERVRQVSDLTMGWCVNCHRSSNDQGVKGRPVRASTDCVTCHF